MSHALNSTVYGRSYIAHKTLIHFPRHPTLSLEALQTLYNTVPFSLVLNVSTTALLYARYSPRVSRRQKILRTAPINSDLWKDTTKSPSIYRPLTPAGELYYARRLSKLPASLRNQSQLYRLKNLGILARMKSDIQFITTPSSDTPGTALLLSFDDKRYVFGQVHEGFQRAGLQFGARFPKVKDIFLTGRTEWANTGGLLGLVLTLADGANATAAAKAETVRQKEERTKRREETATKSQKRSKEGVAKQKEEDLLQSSGGDAQDISTLRIHGAPNIMHTMATARSFIFRQGMPIDVEEYKESHEATVDGDGLPPTFIDSRIQLWALPIRPTYTNGHNQSPSSSSNRKRSLEDYMDGQRPAPEEILEQCHTSSNQQESLKIKDQQLRELAVTEMFKSKWRQSHLIEMPLNQVKLPANVFVRDPVTEKLMRYDVPISTGADAAPDKTVLVREPWPGALIDHLPPTKPSSTAMSYIVKNHKLRGKFRPQEAKRLGVKPGPLFSRLSQGLSVQLGDGSTVTPEMVLEPSKDGGGFAIIDLPSREYIPNLFTRPEWKREDVMVGVGAFIWILGPGVAQDETLLKFMAEFKDMKHVVSAPDVCADSMMMTRAAAACVRHHRVDPDRYPVLRHISLSIAPIEGLDLDVSPVPYVVARQGLRIQLEPSIGVDEAPIVDQLAEVLAQGDIPQEASSYAQEALDDIDSKKTKSEMLDQDLLSPNAEIICLGTGSALPSLERNVSATLLRVPGSGSYLLDCGENTLGQLRRMFAPEKLQKIFEDLKLIWISHLHADHHLGTTSVIKAWYDAVHGGDPVKRPRADKLELLMDPASYLKEAKKLYVVADGQMARWLDEYSSVEDFGYDQTIPLKLGKNKNILEWNGLDLGFHSNDERILAIKEDTGLSDLKYCSVSHCHGASAVVLTFPNGFKVSYSGDCRPSRSFARIGQGSTVLLHEATFDDEMKGDAIAKKHSTISEAIGVGIAMNARRVILTHFSQRYSRLPTMDDVDKAALELKDAEEAEASDVEVMDAPVDIQPGAQSTNDLVEKLGPPSQEEHAEGKPSEERGDASLQTEDDVALPKVPNKDMKIGVAFDYMIVKVRDIMLLEKFTPALRELYKDRDKDVEAKGRLQSAASVRVDSNVRRGKAEMNRGARGAENEDVRAREEKRTLKDTRFVAK